MFRSFMPMLFEQEEELSGAAPPSTEPDENVKVVLDEQGNIESIGGSEQIQEPSVADGGAEEKPSQPTRAEKRRQRGSAYREIQEQNQRLEAQNRELMNMIHRSEVERAEMRGELRSRPVFGQPPVPEEERIFSELTDKRDAINAEFNALPVEAQQARFGEFKEKIRKVDYQILKAVSGGGQKLDPEALSRQLYVQQIAREHGDVFAHPRAPQWAQGRRAQLIAEGHPDNHQLDELVFDEARAKFNLPRSSGAPTNGQRSATSGTRAGSGPSDSNQQKSLSVPWTAETRRMARLAYPHIQDEAMLKKTWIEAQVRHSRPREA